jgi:hypothetical protein
MISKNTYESGFSDHITEFFVRKTDQKKKKEKNFFVRNNYRERKNKVKLQFQKSERLLYSSNSTTVKPEQT